MKCLIWMIFLMALYTANDCSPRTRANSREHGRIRREFARIRRLFANFFFSRTLANIRRTFANTGGVRANSPVFARSSPRTGGQFARKIFYSTFFKFLANDRSPRTIITQQTVRRERLFGEQSFATREQSFAPREQSFTEN